MATMNSDGLTDLYAGAASLTSVADDITPESFEAFADMIRKGWSPEDYQRYLRALTAKHPL